ncbi:hypothetical protein QYE76_071062 [Lolium multiflorum]|uniref:Uncharacterized protein n=1 Tax=Lolium multiflorum TaxID=4521 RepID=A0AAD8SJC8_LOLMU|nr:hypothetical protein QYE76_071062 [Lolium multiflorum]
MARPIVLALLAAALLVAGADAIRPEPWIQVQGQQHPPPPTPATATPRTQKHLHPAAIAAIATASALLVAILLSVGIFLCCRRRLPQAVAAEGEQLAGRSQVVVHMTATQVRA